MKSNNKKQMYSSDLPEQQGLKLTHTVEWTKKLMDTITKLDGWCSSRCILSWKLKRSDSGRTYFLLHAGRKVNVDCQSGLTCQLLPTPTTGSNRNSRNAVHRIGSAHQHHGVSLGLAQVLEIASGILPKEFDSWSQVPAFYNRMFPTPTAREHIGGRHPEKLKAKGRKPSNSLGDTINTITGKVSRINPLFILEMMGFSSDWLLRPFVTPKKTSLTNNS